MGERCALLQAVGKSEMERQKRNHRFRRCAMTDSYRRILPATAAPALLTERALRQQPWQWTSVGSTAAPLATDADQIFSIPPDE